MACGIARPYDVPEAPTFSTEDGWDVTDEPKNGLMAPSEICSNVMHCTNGNIGLGAQTDSESSVCTSNVIMNGVCALAPNPPSNSIALPKWSEELLPLCTIGAEATLDGERCFVDSDDAKSPRRRCLSLKRGCVTSYATFVDGASDCRFTMTVTRFVSLVNLSQWGIEISLSNFSRVNKCGPGPTVQVTVALQLDVGFWPASLQRVQLTPYGCHVDAVPAGGADTAAPASMGVATDLQCVCIGSEGETLKRNDAAITPSDVDGGLQSIVEHKFKVDWDRASLGITITVVGTHVRCNDNDLVTATHGPRNQLECDCVRLFDELLARQSEVLEQLWTTSDTSAQLYDATHPHRLTQGLRYGAYCVFCNAIGCGPTRGLTSAGLTRTSGPAGRVNFAQQIFHGIYLTYTHPSLAKQLLLHQFALLPQARVMARKLGIPVGAVYPSQTITGLESRSYFLSAARLYINADLAYLVFFYLESQSESEKNESHEDFMCHSLEFVLETARIWLHVGMWSDSGETFEINFVTGPDEYSTLVEDSFYTHLMAQRHIKNTCELYNKLQFRFPSRVDALMDAIKMTSDEIAELQRAADAIVLHRDDRHEVYYAHRHFPSLKKWDATAQLNHPLPLNYHPLVIYQHQWCQIPDVLLAMLLGQDKYGKSELRRNVEFYEPLCTHDVPESLAVFAAAQFRALGDFGKCSDLCIAAAQLDLDNLMNDAANGIHLSTMSAAWLVIAVGIGGLNVKGGTVHLSPSLPVGWESCKFSLVWRGSMVRVTICPTEIHYDLIGGSAFRLIHFDTLRIRLHTSEPLSTVAACTHVVLPRYVKQEVTTHFDGVIFVLDTILQNSLQFHFDAWYEVLERFLQNVRVLENRSIPPLGLEEFARVIMNQRNESELSGLDEFLRSRGIELPLGSQGDADVVESRFGLANAKVSELANLLNRQPPGGIQLQWGVNDLLKDLHRLGLRVALVSYTRSMRDILAKLKIPSALITTTIDGYEARAKHYRGRPSTDLYEAAAKKMHLPTTRCVVFASYLGDEHAEADLRKFHLFLNVLPSTCASSPTREAMSTGATPPSFEPPPVNIIPEAAVIHLRPDQFPRTTDQLEDWIMERQRLYVKRERANSKKAMKANAEVQS